MPNEIMFNVSLTTFFHVRKFFSGSGKISRCVDDIHVRMKPKEFSISIEIVKMWTKTNEEKRPNAHGNNFAFFRNASDRLIASQLTHKYS